MLISKDVRHSGSLEIGNTSGDQEGIIAWQYRGTTKLLILLHRERIRLVRQDSRPLQLYADKPRERRGAING